MEKIINIQDFSHIREVFGIEDRNLKFLEKRFKVTISLKPHGLSIKGPGDKVGIVENFIKKMMELSKQGLVLNGDELKAYAGAKSLEEGFESGKNLKEGEVGIRVFSAHKKFVFAKTSGQQEYVKAMREHDIVFSVGPAGTGKTYLAMAMAVNSLMSKKVGRIILTRPAIEAGESLGFLPGDMHEKLGPYLRPLYDALYDMMEADTIEDYIETGVIEVAPLAYMRGRTLNNAFIILDEAQNCTSEQLKMFITRFGFDSKAVITGDITQSDLPGGRPTGLMEGIDILKPIKDIRFITLGRKDVVRHPLVQKIIQAYEDFFREKTV
ncbi:MAG: PhoH family protein [Candidatus Omnitrophica bacterium]|jgi:phosphate starvation-inducible PhoH-like protein|nr:PhoH family protein [Candidatus Omnitrophota bacterium]